MATTNELPPPQDAETSVAVLAWWQLEESAWCPFCLQAYAWELHIACIVCDRSSCPLCVDHEHADGPHCPECGREPSAPEPTETST